MAVLVMVQGESGTGKTTSLRNLADRISLVNVAGKRLPFRGKVERCLNTDEPGMVIAALQKATSDIIVIDDVQYIMAHAFFRRRAEKGYDKFSDIGGAVYDIIKAAAALPDTKRVYFLWHTEQSDFGKIKAKTLGKMLDDKLVVEGEFPIVLRTLVQDGHYYFSTRNNGNDCVKTPLEMFRTELIDNDLAEVDKTICEYYGIQTGEKKAPAKK
jgi:hypothetical protein